MTKRLIPVSAERFPAWRERSRARRESNRNCVICHKTACAGLAAAARLDHGEKHRSPTRNTPQARAFCGTDAKEVPILWVMRLRFKNEEGAKRDAAERAKRLKAKNKAKKSKKKKKKRPNRYIWKSFGNVVSGGLSSLGKRR